MSTKQFVLTAIGSCAVDTILTVPHFPQQDSKLRATSMTRRRGGNCPNTLEVLQQLVLIDKDSQLHDANDHGSEQVILDTISKLNLVATLPTKTSPHIPFISSSFTLSGYEGSSHDPKHAHEGTLRYRKLESIIDLSHCIHRDTHTEPVSSYIISDDSSGSRTVVNYNDLKEMTTEEFANIADAILSTKANSSESDRASANYWFHFEGRIPDTTLECLRYLREHFKSEDDDASASRSELIISVEVEKPKREGLQELTSEADVIFYARSWAEGEGYQSAAQCLEEQAKWLQKRVKTQEPRERLLICAWGDRGASALCLPVSTDDIEAGDIVHSPAHDLVGRNIVDSVGAGDTFIAGMLFCLMCRSSTVKDQDWSMKQKLAFTNGLAGRKILQNGFANLGHQVRPLFKQGDMVMP